jgi:Protein of unknown function (DUF1501)
VSPDSRDIRLKRALAVSRRQFFARSGVLSLGGLALGAMPGLAAPAGPMRLRPSPMRAKARSVIYLHMSGAPPSLDLFDWKPELKRRDGEPCPESLLKGRRFAFIKGVPKLLASPYRFTQSGAAGGWFSETIPHIASIADDISVVRSVWTDQFNHAPAELFVFTGNMRPGAASMGSWITYGLGTENQDLPGFVVLLSGGTDPTGGKSLWGSGFLPGVYQGVQCRSSGQPILFSENPRGMTRESRRRSLDAIRDLDLMDPAGSADPGTLTRIEQYELAFRMQASVPDVFDIGRETKETQELYGAKPGSGSFANNCLLARRLVERGVRFVQLFDWGWDIHGTGPHDDLMTQFPQKCRDADRACAALILDLKRRGLLDETLVVWGGEFGRTPMNEARGGSTFLGRDHHPGCFSMWMAGGGIRRGGLVGATDDFGYEIASEKVTVRDLQATILHLMGFDPLAFTFRDQGLDQRLVGPTGDARPVQALLA